MSTDQPPSLRVLYPHATEEELLRAEEALDRFAIILLKCFDDLLADPERYRAFIALTEAKANSTKKEIIGSDFHT